MLERSLLALMLLAGMILAPGGAARAASSVVLYRETFNVPDPNPDGAATAAALGWKGFRNGGSYNNPCSSTPQGETCLQAFGSGSTQLPSVGNPAVFTHPGNAFWSPIVLGVTIYTTEFPISLPLLRQSTVSFETKANVYNAPSRLALLIGSETSGTWYISDQVVQHQAGAGTWQANSFTHLDTALFGTTPTVTSCTTPPCGPFIPTSFTQTLPTTGTVTAIGVFADGTSGNIRYDNFTITSGAFDNFGQCLDTLTHESCGGNQSGRQALSCIAGVTRQCLAAFAPSPKISRSTPF